ECGGTHTTALAVLSGGTRLKTIEAGAANLRLVDDATLGQVLSTIAEQYPDPAAVGIGMAGCRDEADRQRVYGVLGAIWPRALAVVSHDLETAWRAAGSFSDEPWQRRVVVVAGTGACTYAKRPDGNEVKVGGWGHLLGDRGSAYEIGHQALRHAIVRWDRLGRWGTFGAAALRRLALNTPDDLIGWIQLAPKGEVAALAKDAFACLGSDTSARAAIEEAAAGLAADAIACMKRVAVKKGAMDFCLAGGLFEHQPAYERLVTKLLLKSYPDALVRRLKESGAWGAVLMAREGFLRLTTLGGSDPSNGPDFRPTRTKRKTPTGTPALLIPKSLDTSPTERRNPRSMELDQMRVSAAIELILSEDAQIPAALLAEKEKLARLIAKVAKALGKGGRLFYVGAGTSGRLGVLDASECPPTFRTPPEWVQGIMAGGAKALLSAVEGAEDDFAGGSTALRLRGVAKIDVVLGIAASGRTPFVWGALAAAREAGALTALLCFNPYLEMKPQFEPDMVFGFDLGPEVLTGSTRMKAGTATKLFLNCLTTLAMVRLGKVASNLMIDLNPSNEKLRDRAVRIVAELTGCDQAVAHGALLASRWVVKDAVKQVKLGLRNRVSGIG
ncbi:MAG TPA: N-acetylmuramic acid 6-phosphate etherase, partial [Candidatus Limnocylindria bacterium]|nr:N-acetylmuramic acid 6-phosphate etherase [Candidatus Limnocylindria bacterium]